MAGMLKGIDLLLPASGTSEDKRGEIVIKIVGHYLK